MRWSRPACVLALVVVACGEDEPRASEDSSVGSITLTGTGTTLGTGSEDGTSMGESIGTTVGPSTAADSDSDGDGPKFDLEQQPDVPPEVPDSGCTKVDFLFVID